MRWFSAVILVSVAAVAVTAQDPVAEFARNYPAFQRGQFTVTTRASYDPKSPPRTTVVSRVWMDPPRWKIIDRSSTTSIQDGKPATYTLLGEQVTTESGQMTVSADPATGRAVRGVVASVKPLPPAQARRAGFGLFSFAIDGRTVMNDHLSLAELIREATVRTEPGSHNGKNVVVVHATGRRGRLTVWLDPARGYLPLRVVQERSADDLIDDGQRLKSITKDEDGKPTFMEGFTEEHEVTRIATVGGRQMVTSFNRRVADRWADGSASESNEQVTLSDIRVVDRWETDPFVISTVIPDGTRVTAEDDKPIQYVWRGGRIVKDVNQDVAGGDVEPFLPSRGSNWWWVVGPAAALAVAALWRFAARRRA